MAAKATQSAWGKVPWTCDEQSLCSDVQAPRGVSGRPERPLVNRSVPLHWIIPGAYGALGAALATLLLLVAHWTGLLQRIGVASTPGMLQSGATAVQQACVLHATTVDCDRCMMSSCVQECRACGSSPQCLGLFACMLDCNDQECNHLCVQAYPEGKPALARFMGERGCMAKHCSSACR
jgi:hypothetical protein